jgi:hypothetical protein
LGSAQYTHSTVRLHPGTILLKTFYEVDINGNSFFQIVVNEKKWGTGTVVILLGADKPSETTALGEKFLLSVNVLLYPKKLS